MPSPASAPTAISATTAASSRRPACSCTSPAACRIPFPSPSSPPRAGKAYRRVSTPWPEVPHTFAAPDFDTLYDCPILVGNQEILTFEAAGKPHTVAAYDLGSFDRAKFTGDLGKIVEAAAALMGELPYRHYAFLVIGPGGGGLEHLNSTAVALNPASLASARGYQGWLSFIAHEYFHLFNVKSIRPIALGPFDYDRENYTDLLWFSEGVTVYYEYMLLNRAGLMTRDEVLERLGSTIAGYENAPGRRHQPAALSSFDTWTGFFGRNEHAAGDDHLLLRHRLRAGAPARPEDPGGLGRPRVARRRHAERSIAPTTRRRSAASPAAELREVCEKAAGAPLDEIFDVYARTIRRGTTRNT